MREARGSALVNARQAINDSKSTYPSVVLVGKNQPEALDANAILRLACSLLDQRTRRGWEAIHATEQSLEGDGSMSEASDGLGITKQAPSQRLQAANWKLETESLPTVRRALAAAVGVSILTAWLA